MVFSRQIHRQGAAAVELAVCLPLLVFLLMIVVDFARDYDKLQVLSQCARVAAAYESDSDLLDVSVYDNAEEAALATAANLTPAPEISIREVTDAAGNSFVKATASYPFRLLLGVGLPNDFTLERTAYAQHYPSQDE
jgi:Flp pilus assembly protein TadG